jgi:hypothetical protein
LEELPASVALLQKKVTILLGIIPMALECVGMPWRFVAENELLQIVFKYKNHLYDASYSPFAVEKVPTLNLHGVLCGPEGKSYALLSQVVILWYEFNSERG